MLAAVAVPLNTLFGTVAAVLITRNEFPGKVWGVLIAVVRLGLGRLGLAA